MDSYEIIIYGCFDENRLICGNVEQDTTTQKQQQFYLQRILRHNFLCGVEAEISTFIMKVFYR